MAPAMADPDRTLPASPRKIQRARADGQVPRSRELGHLVALGLGGLLLWLLARPLGAWVQQILVDGLTLTRADTANPAAMGERLGTLALRGLLLIVPMGLVMGAAGVAAATLSGGWNFSAKAVAPKFSRLNPLSGLARVVSKDQWLDAGKVWLLVLLLGGVGAAYLQARFMAMTQLLALPLASAPALVGNLVATGFALLLVLVGTIALIDVPWQRKQWADKLKMTHQEARQESKDADGNTEVKGKIKHKMREVARRRMITAVPKADLVVMNPSHYAVALAYDEARMGAPRVVAKGMDAFAMRIRDVARGAGVPVLQAPPLARALYAHVPLDGEVPAELFAAVAAVLAWVYQLRASPSTALAAPHVEVPSGMDPGPGAVPSWQAA